jgi:DNA primase
MEGAFLANFIPDQKISEIRSAADIVEVIGDVVHLKRTGKNFSGLCPFHSEKTPSFTVSPDKQIFHCFGCGTGGNIFSFLMKHEGISFPEAVRAVARRYGIDLPDRPLSPDQKRRRDVREQLFSLNHRVADEYHALLINAPEAEQARRYLVERGITQETIRDFQLGYAPDRWEHITQVFRRKSISGPVIESSGLVIPRKNRPGCYDRFRHRIIFPIKDIRGRVIGFGGRVLGDGVPKYLNSPETPLYHKSRSLYGMQAAKGPCRESEMVYIVEGYLDLIALHQHGIRNVVATLGTALTEEHLRALRGLIGEGGRAILVYDSDEAGIRAARRSIPVFDKGFVNAQILTLQSGYDPDSFVFEFGADAFTAAAKNAKNMIPFLLDCAVNEYGLSVDGKVRTVNALLDPLLGVKDRIERALYIKEVAERIGVEEGAIVQKLRDAVITKSNRPSPGPATDRTGQRPAGQTTDVVGRLREIVRRTRRGRLEMQIVAMMLQFPPIITEIRRHGVVDYIEIEALKRIGRVAADAWQSENPQSGGPDPAPQGFIAEITNRLDDESLRQMAVHLAIEDEDWSHQGCVKLINHFVDTARKRIGLKDIEDRIKQAELNDDQDLLEKLLTEKQNMAVLREKRKMAVFNKG